MIVQASCSKKNFRQVVYHRNFCGRYKEPKLLYNGRTRSYSLAASNQRYSRQAGLLGYYSRPPFSMIEADEFLTKLNCLHPSLKFTFEKKKKNVYRFLMFASKEQILALKSVYTGSLLSPASIYVGSALVLSNVKQV